ncbi:4-hydroxy-tetrahydrodipicolinate reductase [Lactococcus cremoris]|nr:4-hydroxy-tetrahydrodipicolinate reductase [Lactococcus cremoris]
MNKVKIIVAGYRGKMGSEAVQMILKNDEFELVGLLGHHEVVSEAFGVPVFNKKEELIGLSADIWLDLTAPSLAYENTRFAMEAGFRPVVGTTGFTEEEVTELVRLSRVKHLGGLIAPNFALGAVLVMQFSKIAAQYFPDVEIIELHHDAKKDAPSGTALKTAELMAQVRQAHYQGAANETESLAGARGAEFEGMRIHSVRLPGLVAHQEVLFGGKGEGLTLRHDSYERSSFMTGVALGIKKVMQAKELYYGLEHFLDL